MGLLGSVLYLGFFGIFLIGWWIWGIYCDYETKRNLRNWREMDDRFRKLCQSDEYSDVALMNKCYEDKEFKEKLYKDAEEVLKSIDKSGKLAVPESINYLKYHIYRAKNGQVDKNIDWAKRYPVLPCLLQDYTITNQNGTHPCSNYLTNLFLKWYSNEIQSKYPEFYICRYKMCAVRGHKEYGYRYAYRWNVYGHWESEVIQKEPISTLSDEELKKGTNLLP